VAAKVLSMLAESPDGGSPISAEDVREMVAEEVRKAIVQAAKPKDSQKRRGRPRKRVAELDVDQWVAAQLANDLGFRHLSRRQAAELGPFSASALGNCRVWKQMKEGLKQEAERDADRAREEFEGRMGEDEEGPGIRVGRKHALGRQRASKKDQERYRAAGAFIAFNQWLKDRGIPWPTLKSGRLDLSDDCFRSQTKALPEAAEELRKHYLAIGPEGRSG
jgi:hypothetical protein